MRNFAILGAVLALICNCEIFTLALLLVGVLAVGWKLLEAKEGA